MSTIIWFILLIPTYRKSNVVLFHQYISSTIVDMFKAIWSKQDTTIPSGYHNQDIVNIQDLQKIFI